MRSPVILFPLKYFRASAGDGQFVQEQCELYMVRKRRVVWAGERHKYVYRGSTRERAGDGPVGAWMG